MPYGSPGLYIINSQIYILPLGSLGSRKMNSHKHIKPSGSPSSRTTNSHNYNIPINLVVLRKAKIAVNSSDSITIKCTHDIRLKQHSAKSTQSSHTYSSLCKYKKIYVKINCSKLNNINIKSHHRGSSTVKRTASLHSKSFLRKIQSVNYLYEHFDLISCYSLTSSRLKSKYNSDHKVDTKWYPIVTSSNRTKVIIKIHNATGTVFKYGIHWCYVTKVRQCKIYVPCATRIIFDIRRLHIYVIIHLIATGKHEQRDSVKTMILLFYLSVYYEAPMNRPRVDIVMQMILFVIHSMVMLLNIKQADSDLMNSTVHSIMWILADLKPTSPTNKQNFSSFCPSSVKDNRKQIDRNKESKQSNIKDGKIDNYCKEISWSDLCKSIKQILVKKHNLILSINITIAVTINRWENRVMSNDLELALHDEDEFLLSDEEDITEQTDSDITIVDQSTILEKDITEISRSAANLELENHNKPTNAKRQRETSEEGEKSLNNSTNGPPLKKSKNVMMEPLEPAVSQAQLPPKQIVRLVPDIENIHLFTRSHLDVLHKSVMVALKACKNPNVKFDFCLPERGRYKFICPNEDAKDFAMNIVPTLTDLWPNPKIKAIDCGNVPRMIRASVIFSNPPPETLDFFEEIDFKNENIDTNNWRAYGKKKIQGNKTVIFIGVDDLSVENLKAIGFRPYFANGRTRITIENTN